MICPDFEAKEIIINFNAKKQKDNLEIIIKGEGGVYQPLTVTIRTVNQYGKIPPEFLQLVTDIAHGMQDIFDQYLYYVSDNKLTLTTKNETDSREVKIIQEDNLLEEILRT